MSTFISDFFANEFILKSTLNLLLFIGAGAPLGFLLIQKKSSLISESLSHSLLPGIALSAVFFGLSSTSLFLGALIWINFMAITIAYFVSKKPEKSESYIFILSISGNALGVCLIKWLEIPLDLTHLLFGSPLLITSDSIIRNSIFLIFLLGILSTSWKKILFFLFDSASASLESGPYLTQFLFISLIGSYLVLGFESLGVMSTAGVLILPAFFASSISQMSKAWMATAYTIGLLSVIMGQTLSYNFDLPLGPTMTLCLVAVGSIFVFSSQLLKRLQ